VLAPGTLRRDLRRSAAAVVALYDGDNGS